MDVPLPQCVIVWLTQFAPYLSRSVPRDAASQQTTLNCDPGELCIVGIRAKLVAASVVCGRHLTDPEYDGRPAVVPEAVEEAIRGVSATLKTVTNQKAVDNH